MGSTDLFHFYPAQDRSASIRLETLGEARRARETGGFIWIACVSPERGELEEIAREFAIHPLSIEDCFDEDQIPKVDVFPEYAEILFNDIHIADFSGTIAIEEINLFFGKGFVISVFRSETARRVSADSIAESVARANPHGAHGSDRIVHAILDRVIDLTFTAVDRLSDAVTELEEECLSREAAIDPAKTHAIRQDLALVRKSLFHERELLARLSRKDSPVVPNESIVFFCDLYDHVAKFLGTVETDRDTVANLAQFSLALSGNEMAKQAAKTNRSMTRLTFITTIFMPLTLIAGIGGMSEWTMMTGADNWKTAYAILVGAMATVGILNYLALKWLNRKE